MFERNTYTKENLISLISSLNNKKFSLDFALSKFIKIFIQETPTESWSCV